MKKKTVLFKPSVVDLQSNSIMYSHSFYKRKKEKNLIYSTFKKQNLKFNNTF